jgi:hypothetical protein
VNFSIQIGVPARRTRACACQAVDGLLVAQVVDAEDERPATAPQLTAISSSCSCADLEQKLRWREHGLPAGRPRAGTQILRSRAARDAAENENRAAEVEDDRIFAEDGLLRRSTPGEGARLEISVPTQS